MNDYSDIINLSRHISPTRKHMSNYDRAAQFAPFSALTGYEQIIKEVARISKKRIVLSADQKEKINRALMFLEENKDKNINIKVIYFVPDKKKDGGEYISIIGIYKKINSSNDKLMFTDNNSIILNDIFDIEILDNSYSLYF